MNDRESAISVLKNSTLTLLATVPGLKIEGEMMAKDNMYLYAISVLKEALKRNPFDLRTANELGLAETLAGQYEGAIKSFEHILAIQPTNKAVLNNIALAYMRAGLMPQAIQALERVLDLAPTAESNSNLGMALVYSGKHCNVAIPYFARGAALAPGAEDIVGYLAHAYRWCGMHTEADRTYRKAIELARAQLRQSPEASVYADVAVYEAALGDSSGFKQDIQSARQHSRGINYDIDFEAAIGLALLGDAEGTTDLLVRLARAGYSMSFLRNNPDLLPYRDRLSTFLGPSMLFNAGGRNSANGGAIVRPH
jgi:tetratricopeptide (TPR) repeat protein